MFARIERSQRYLLHNSTVESAYLYVSYYIS